jgi:hypothetical protein
MPKAAPTPPESPLTGHYALVLHSIGNARSALRGPLRALADLCTPPEEQPVDPCAIAAAERVLAMIYAADTVGEMVPATAIMRIVAWARTQVQLSASMRRA